MNKPINGKLPIPKQLSLIEHTIDGIIIPQRPIDGYIHATAMCKIANKLFSDYKRLDSTQKFLIALSSDMGIPISDKNQSLIIEKAGVGEIKDKGTWVHPNVAIHLAQWLSPEFSVQVTKWVFEWMSGSISGKMPEHLRRYVANMGKVPNGYFSMLNEAMYSLIAPLEQEGYIMPAKLMPDISYGRMFSGFLRDKGIKPEEFPEYQHEFIDGKRPTVTARLYPNKYLGDFRDYLSNVWIPQKAKIYFEKADKKALPFLQNIIPKIENK